MVAYLQLGYHASAAGEQYDAPDRNAERVLTRAVHDATADVPGEYAWEDRDAAVAAVQSRLEPRLNSIRSSRVESGAVYQVEYNQSAAEAWQQANCPSGPDRQFGPCEAQDGVGVQERAGETHLLAVVFDVRVTTDDAEIHLTMVVEAPGYSLRPSINFTIWVKNTNAASLQLRVLLDDHPITALLVVLLVAAAAVPTSSTADVQPADYSTDSISGSEEATVVGVTDGDTIEIRYDNGTTETVRLLGVDTPEFPAENTPDEFEGVPDSSDGETCLYYEGKVASAMAENRLLGERVTLKFDSEADRRGYYGRLLAYIYVDGEHFNYQLIENGHARVYDSTFGKSGEFYAAEDDAQSAGVGAWACEDPASELGEVTIERFHPDPAGDDYASMNDEFVVLQNRRSSSADLSDWRIRDEYGNDYDVPGGVSLDSGETVTLHTGTGSDSAHHLYWGRTDYAVWNNGGDTGYLYDDHGDYVNSKSY